MLGRIIVVLFGCLLASVAAGLVVSLAVLVPVVGDLAHTVTHAYPDKTVELFFYRCGLLGDPKPMIGQQMRWIGKRELKALPFPEADRELITLLS